MTKNKEKNLITVATKEKQRGLKTSGLSLGTSRFKQKKSFRDAQSRDFYLIEEETAKVIATNPGLGEENIEKLWP